MADIVVFVDIVNDERISGWCLDRNDIDTPVHLTLYADEVRVGEAVADQHREDVKAHKFHPTGRCGFTLAITHSGAVHRGNSLVLKAHDTGVPVWRCRTAEVPRILEGDSPAVFFMHIPKTAGTSFNAFVCARLHRDAAAVHIEDLPPERWPALQKEKRYLAGHLPLRVIKQRFDVSRLDLLTLLREPYSQLHSHVAWVKAIGADPGSSFFQNHHRFFQALALRLNEPGLDLVDNLETLTREQPAELASLFDNNQTRYFLDTAPREVSPSDFDEAARGLSSFKLVGVTERYADFAGAFCRMYGTNYIEQQQQFNRSRGERLFEYADEGVRAKLKPLVEADLALYQRVVQDATWKMDRSADKRGPAV